MPLGLTDSLPGAFPPQAQSLMDVAGLSLRGAQKDKTQGGCQVGCPGCMKIWEHTSPQRPQLPSDIWLGTLTDPQGRCSTRTRPITEPQLHLALPFCNPMCHESMDVSPSSLSLKGSRQEKKEAKTVPRPGARPCHGAAFMRITRCPGLKVTHVQKAFHRGPHPVPKHQGD